MTSPLRSIFLVGMTGVGKTSTGRVLSRHLGRTFLDSDHEIAALCGSSVAQLYATQGAAFFRRLECGVIAELSLRQGIVLATGGGAILCPTVRELLKARGFVIYLRGRLETIQARVEEQAPRPVLESPNLVELLRERLGERAHLYEDAAHVAVDCDDLDVSDVALQIATWVQALSRFKRE